VEGAEELVRVNKRDWCKAFVMHCLFSTFPYFSLLIVWKGAISGFGMMA
jgi:hypothetical protein